MDKLSTIQKREKLNDVFPVGDIGPGGAYHKYEIFTHTENDNEPCMDLGVIQFQEGARKLVDSKHGVLDTDLLEIVRHRLQAFQAGPFNSEYNAKALDHIEEALMWLNRRVEDRIERNVLGTNNK